MKLMETVGAEKASKRHIGTKLKQQEPNRERGDRERRGEGDRKRKRKERERERERRGAGEKEGEGREQNRQGQVTLLFLCGAVVVGGGCEPDLRSGPYSAFVARERPQMAKKERQNWPDASCWCEACGTGLAPKGVQLAGCTRGSVPWHAGLATNGPCM